MNKNWNYLVPLDVPESYPSISQEKGAYRAYDPLLGWSLAKLGNEGELYFSDANGYRCSREESLKSLKEVSLDSRKEYDVICIGDSFTHGDEVSFEQTWPFHLSEITGKKVLNLGVGGYGIDQAFLRYQSEKVKARTVILGLISGDLERATTQVYNLTSGGLKTKPIFSFQNDNVTLLNSPAIFGDQLRTEFEKGADSEFFRREMNYYPAIVKRETADVFYSYRLVKSVISWRKNRVPIYSVDDERFRYCVEILKYMNKSIKENGGELIVAILDNETNFPARKKGADPWELIKQTLTANHIKYIDCTREVDELFSQDPDRVINKGGVHYTPEVNLMVARMIAAQLQTTTGKN